MPQRTLLLKTPENATVIATLHGNAGCKVSFAPAPPDGCIAAVWVDGKTQTCTVKGGSAVVFSDALPPSARIALYLHGVNAFGCAGVESGQFAALKLRLCSLAGEGCAPLPPPTQTTHCTENGAEACKCDKNAVTPQECHLPPKPASAENTPISSGAPAPFEVLFARSAPCTPFADALHRKWRQLTRGGKHLFFGVGENGCWFGIEGAAHLPPDGCDYWEFIPFDGATQEGVWITKKP